MTEGRRSASMARRKSFPGPRMCSWPTKSSRERGRIRAANGAASPNAGAVSLSLFPKRSCTKKKYGARIGAHLQFFETGLTGFTRLPGEEILNPVHPVNPVYIPHRHGENC